MSGVKGRDCGAGMRDDSDRRRARTCRRPTARAPLVTCRAAAEALRGLPGLRLAALSRWYPTAPVLRAGAPREQPPYVNGVARLEGADGTRRSLLAPAAGDRGAGRAAARGAGMRRARSISTSSRWMGWCAMRPTRCCRIRARTSGPSCCCRCWMWRRSWVHPRLRRTAAELLATLPGQQAVVIIQELVWITPLLRLAAFFLAAERRKLCQRFHLRLFLAAAPGRGNRRWRGAGRHARSSAPNRSASADSRAGSCARPARRPRRARSPCAIAKSMAR